MFDSFNILKVLNNPSNILSDSIVEQLVREFDVDDIFAEIPKLLEGGLRVIFVRTIVEGGHDYETIESLTFDRNRLAQVPAAEIDAEARRIWGAIGGSGPENEDGIIQAMLMAEMFRITAPDYAPKAPLSERKYALQAGIEKAIPDESILVLDCPEENGNASIRSGFLLSQNIVLVNGAPV